MKKVILLCCLMGSFSVFADNNPMLNVQVAAQPSAQVSLGPNSQDSQQINHFFDKSEYKYLKHYKFNSLFKVPAHD